MIERGGAAGAFVRLAQLRGRVAALARGGHYDLAIAGLGELVRVDLRLGLPADAVQRARQAAELAEAGAASASAALVVLGATLLASGAPEAAIDACSAAIARARPDERPRLELLARLVGGAAQRRAGRLGDARLLLDAARGAAARLGESIHAGLALAELAWIDLAEHRSAAAATCFEFAAEFLRRGADPSASVEADALAVACWALDDPAIAIERADRVIAAARAAGRTELAAYCDSVLAELAVRRTPADAAAACARAAQSAREHDSPLARELAVQARLRQVRIAADERDRERHLEAGIELALALAPDRAGAQLGHLLVALVDDAAVTRRPELRRIAAAIGGLGTGTGDVGLTELANAVLVELDREIASDVGYGGRDW